MFTEHSTIHSSFVITLLHVEIEKYKTVRKKKKNQKSE